MQETPNDLYTIKKPTHKRICRKCAQSLEGYWYLFCDSKSPYDHATTKPCDFCGNIRFTAKVPVQ